MGAAWEDGGGGGGDGDGDEGMGPRPPPGTAAVAEDSCMKVVAAAAGCQAVLAVPIEEGVLEQLAAVALGYNRGVLSVQFCPRVAYCKNIPYPRSCV